MATHSLCAVLQSSDKKLIRWGYSPYVASAGEELLDCTGKSLPPALDYTDPGPYYWHESTETWELTAP